jgi:hypothetical protein
MNPQTAARSQLLQNPFLTIFHDSDSATLTLLWSPETARMTEADFKEGLTKTAEYAERYKIRGLLVDVEKFQFGKAMGPELSKWRTENIVPRYNKAGLKKFAFVHGKDFPEKGGDGERGASEEFFTKHFASEQHARHWLSS